MGHAKDYVKAMDDASTEAPKDYVVSSNTTISVREFVEKVLSLKEFRYIRKVTD